MSELFTEVWMQGFAEQWNAEPELSDALAQIGFNSVIGYGFDGDEQPHGVLTVENGKAVKAEAYNANPSTGISGRPRISGINGLPSHPE